MENNKDNMDEFLDIMKQAYTSFNEDRKKVDMFINNSSEGTLLRVRYDICRMLKIMDDTPYAYADVYRFMKERRDEIDARLEEIDEENFLDYMKHMEDEDE